MNTVILLATILKVHAMSETPRGMRCVTAFVKVALGEDGSKTTLAVSAYGNTADRLAVLQARDKIIVEGSLNSYRSGKDGTTGFEVRARRITVVSATEQDHPVRKENSNMNETPIIEGVEARPDTARFSRASDGETLQPRDVKAGRAVTPTETESEASE